MANVLLRTMFGRGEDITIFTTFLLIILINNMIFY